ncbi:MAG: hypothetical protein JW762_00755, partial [Dehalococcoidales bacterium]|nr:hypothetical protein [Dehalococcoidales bacterium]
MWYQKCTTLEWIYIWGGLTILFSVIQFMVDSPWDTPIFYITLSTFLILVGGLIYRCIIKTKRKRRLNNLDCHFLIPKSEYPNKRFGGAPKEQETTNKMSIRDGTYTLLLEIISQETFQFEPLVITLAGSSDNRPDYLGTNNLYVVDTLNDGMLRNWWGQLIVPAQEYPRVIYSGDALIHGMKIKTHGLWCGQIHVQIRIVGEIIVDCLLHNKKGRNCKQNSPKLQQRIPRNCRI